MLGDLRVHFQIVRSPITAANKLGKIGPAVPEGYDGYEGGGQRVKEDQAAKGGSRHCVEPVKRRGLQPLCARWAQETTAERGKAERTTDD